MTSEESALPISEMADHFGIDGFESYYTSPGMAIFSNGKRTFASLKLHFVEAPYLYVYDCGSRETKMFSISRIHKPVRTENPVDKRRAKEIKLDHFFGEYGKREEGVISDAIVCTKTMVIKFKEQKIH